MTAPAPLRVVVAQTSRGAGYLYHGSRATKLGTYIDVLECGHRIEYQAGDYRHAERRRCKACAQPQETSQP